MDLDELKEKSQKYFTDGLVTIVGLGLSASYGLPTMEDLSKHLRAEIPKRITGNDVVDWTAVEYELASGVGLETALDKIPIRSSLIPVIVDVSADLMLELETVAVQGILASGMPMPFSTLVQLLVHANNRADIVTTNYDRLIELAVEMANIRVDCAFPSAYFSQSDANAARQQVEWLVPAGKRNRRHVQKHVRLSKPHGSLDWYEFADGPIRSAMNLGQPRLMVSPGASKYLRGYDMPFDLHRDRANEAFRNAARFLFIGYGFNDQHLEVYLRARLDKGMPALVLTKKLTSSALDCVMTHPAMIALEMSDSQTGTRVLTSSTDDIFEEISIWELDNFIREVLT